MEIAVKFVHVIVCLALVLVVLLQTGKRADLAGAFGGGGSQTAFGARGAATFLSKMTTAAAVMFMISSLTLAIMSSNSGDPNQTVLDEVEQTGDAPEPAPQELPLLPSETPTAPVETDESPVGSEDDSPIDEQP